MINIGTILNNIIRILFKLINLIVSNNTYSSVSFDSVPVAPDGNYYKNVTRASVIFSLNYVPTFYPMN